MSEMTPIEYRVKYKLTPHQVKTLKFDLDEFQLQMNRKKHIGELIIYDNQLKLATDIRKCFDDRSTLVVSAIAPCQSGKTGAMICLVGELMKHQDIQLEDIFIITGHSSKSWEEQTRTRLPDCLSSRVFHRNNLLAFRSIVATKRNVLIIIDEMHIAAGEQKSLHNLFKSLGFMNSETMRQQDIKIAEFSATPDGVIDSRIKQWGKHEHKTVKGEPGPNYMSLEKYDESGRLREAEDLTGFTRDGCRAVHEKAKENLSDLIVEIQRFYGEDYRHHIIRMPQHKDAQAMLKANIEECIGNVFEVKTWAEARDEISCLDTFLKVKPPKHTFILVKEMLRCADTIEKRHLGVVYERYSKNPSDSAQIQGLLGRVCGYGVPDDILVYVKLESVRKYMEIKVGDFKTKPTKKWKSVTTGKRTYADNENYSCSSNSNNPLHTDNLKWYIFDSRENTERFVELNLNFKMSTRYNYKANNVNDRHKTAKQLAIAQHQFTTANNRWKRIMCGSDDRYAVYWDGNHPSAPKEITGLELASDSSE